MARARSGVSVEVPLRARDGSVRAVALIDTEDALEVLRHRWYLSAGYAARNATLADGRRRLVLLHRVLLELGHGDPRQADHINRDRLDCRRANLRVCTQAENMQNLATERDARSSSRYRGVSFDRRTGRWMARVRGHHLGRFDSEADAALAAARYRAEHMPFSAEAA